MTEFLILLDLSLTERTAINRTSDGNVYDRSEALVMTVTDCSVGNVCDRLKCW